MFGGAASDIDENSGWSSSEEDNHNGANGGAASTPRLRLRIRPTYSHGGADGTASGRHCGDLLLSVRSDATVDALAGRVRRRLGLAPDRYLRLVCRGRLLAPNAAKLDAFGALLRPLVAVTEGEEENGAENGHADDTATVVHAVVAAPGQTGGAQAVLQQRQRELRQSREQRQLLRGAGVGRDGRPIRTAAEDEEDDNNDDGWGEEVSLSESDVDHDREESNAEVEPQDIDLELGHTGSHHERRRRRQGGTVLRRPYDRASVGFDRLRRRPWRLSASQVQALRASFAPQLDAWLQPLASVDVDQILAELRAELGDTANHANETPGSPAVDVAADGNDDPSRRRRLLEEAWMRTQGPLSELWLNLGAAGLLREPLGAAVGLGGRRRTSRGAGGIGALLASAAAGRDGGLPLATTNNNSPSLGNAGTDRDFTWGFCLGFFVGYITVLWLWIPTVPHRRKLGILTGVTVQLALGMLQKGNDPEDGAIGEAANYDDVGLLIES